MRHLALFLVIMIGCNSCQSFGQKPDNKLPMYGEVPKSQEYKKSDAQFINETIASIGSREKGCQHYIQRGWAYFYHDSLDLSMKRFNQAWLLNPENPDIYFGFGALTEIKGDTTNAKRFYEMGIQKDANHDRAEICYQKIADCEEQLGDTSAVIKAYKNILSLNSKNVFALKKLGYFYDELGNDDAALVNYNKAIEFDPSDANTYNNRGFLYQKINQNKNAIEDYTKAVKLDSGFIGAYANRGVAKMESGDNYGATIDFEKCVSLDPNSGQLRRLLGQAKLNLKNLKGACNDFEIAAKLGDPDAKTLMEKLCNKK